MIQQLPLSLFRPIPLPLHPPQQESRSRIQIREEQLLLLSHPHPQFVAVKSLILFPPEISFTLVSYAKTEKVLQISFVIS